MQPISTDQIGDEIYVLHAFTKKTQKASLSDINMGKARYKMVTHP